MVWYKPWTWGAVQNYVGNAVINAMAARAAGQPPTRKFIFSDRQKRKAFTNHIINNAAAVVLTPDELGLLLAMVQVYNLHHKKELMTQLGYFSYHEPRLDVLTRHLKMAVPDFRKFKQMVGRVKKSLPNF